METKSSQSEDEELGGKWFFCFYYKLDRSRCQKPLALSKIRENLLRISAMSRIYLSILVLISHLCFVSLHAQSFKVLHYTETSGFDHGTRQNSLAMFQSLGVQHGFTVDDDQTGAAFSSLASLQTYAVVVFSNTSGDQILDSAQRANFEAYINGGGAWVGIHAASDTYRHSSANGNNTGTWDWYAETLGGSVQENPNHTSANHNGTLDVLLAHPTTANIPDPWNKVEEYYYWENGFLATDNVELLEVRSTGSNSYDAVRPVSWYKELSGGARIFYTSLGHDNFNYTGDTAFKNHLRDAVFWAANKPVSLKDPARISPFQLYPNPARDELQIIAPGITGLHLYRILDVKGAELASGKLEFLSERASLAVDFLPVGHYVLQISFEAKSETESLPFVIR